eukprot:TRINITY_DN17511_c0_g1_i1.p1 TRINITY_DN17511_c0_g1~~TRINITY_DN17511_c0_g1_i1.p1  ORF type:complete len:662 (+),score=144.49 TRINITY_DN17511_c0_g1_i1:40-2025(+)
MDVQLSFPGGVYHEVEVGPAWCVSDLRKAAADELDGREDKIVLVINETEYGAQSDDKIPLQSLGVWQGEVIIVKVNNKQAALDRLRSRGVAINTHAAQEASRRGDTETVTDLIEADCAEGDLVLFALETKHPETALAVLKCSSSRHFSPGAFALAIKTGAYDVVAQAVHNGLTRLPKGFSMPCQTTSDWKIFDLLFDNGMSTSYLKMPSILWYSKAEVLRRLLPRFEGKVPLSWVAIALKNPDPTIAEMLLKRDVKLSCSPAEDLLFSKHRQFDGRVAQFIRDIGKELGFSKKKATRLMRNAPNLSREIIAAIVEVGGDPSMGLLHSKDLATVRSLVEDFGADVNSRTGCWTLLISACELGDEDLVRYLVEHKAEVNHHVTNGRTALIAASKKGDLNIVKYLVEEGGADPLHRTRAGFNATSAAAACGHPAVVEYLVLRCRDTLKGMNLIHINARIAGASIYKELYRITGMGLFERDDLGKDVLMMAAESGKSVARGLASDCAEIANRKCKKGTTALGYAIQKGERPEYMIDLLEAGSNPNAKMSDDSDSDMLSGLIANHTIWHRSVYEKLKERGAELQGERCLQSLLASFRKGDDLTKLCMVFGDVMDLVPDDSRRSFIQKLLARDANLKCRLRYYCTPNFLSRRQAKGAIFLSSVWKNA